MLLALAGSTGALDNVFNHPNVAPFIARRLIQNLVTSNPSPAYIGRVAAIFNDNGQGVRGDLGAVVRTILLDPEARYGQWQHAATLARWLGVDAGGIADIFPNLGRFASADLGFMG